MATRNAFYIAAAEKQKTVILAIEIERKYLVKTIGFLGNLKGTRLLQGYIFETEKCVARVRLSHKKAWLTLKGATRGLEREEFEYQIPHKEAHQILTRFCVGRMVDKTRYELKDKDFCWEVDVFHGENEGLYLAEVELKTVDQEFILPTWLGKEVSHDTRYFNSQLARNPYKKWSET